MYKTILIILLCWLHSVPAIGQYKHFQDCYHVSLNFQNEPPQFLVTAEHTLGRITFPDGRTKLTLKNNENSPRHTYSLSLLNENNQPIQTHNQHNKPTYFNILISVNDSTNMLIYSNQVSSAGFLNLGNPNELKRFNDSVANYAGIYYTVIRTSNDGSPAKIVDGKDHLRLFTGQFYNLNILRVNNRVFLTAMMGNDFYSFKIEDESITAPLVSRNLVQLYSPGELIFPLVGVAISSNSSGHMLVSVSKNYTNSTNTPVHSAITKLIKLDPVQGNIITSQLVYEKYSNDQFNFVQAPQEMVFSPNDSFFYVAYYDHGNSQYQFKQCETFANSGIENGFDLLGDSPGIGVQSILLAPNQKIYCSGGDEAYHLIKYPDKKGPSCRFLINAFPLGYYYARQYFGVSEYHNIKRDFNLTVDCDSSLKIHNLTDTLSISITQFNWYIYDASTGQLVDTSHETHPVFRLKREGKYWLKFKSYFPSGYSPWYSDTIDYSFPKVPKIMVSYQDSIKCRFSSFTFTDNSNYGLPGKPEYQRWDVSFGDGHDTSFKGQISNLAYAYPDTGIFSIHLQLTDGYCMDSITLTPPVQIRDAPAPGIIADINEGCQVFQTRIRRNRPDPILDAAFSLNSGLSWEPLNRSSDNQDIDDLVTIKSPGQYSVLVRLDGPSGCQTIDSVSIRVMQGFEPTDTMDWSYATTTENNRVFIRWDSLYAAQYYRVFWDNDSSVTLTDPSYTFQFEAEKEYAIHINAYDSCGKIIGSGPLENIWLEGTNKENESIDLNWNYPASWSNPRFEINTKEDPLWNSLVSVPASVYRHSDFVESGLNELCYYIQLEEGHVFADSIQSNRICVPLHPVIWIPNSFTPNSDNLNDFFSVYTLGITDLNLSIYNRFGQLIYTDQGSEVVWDGSQGGNPVQEGVYLYTLRTVQIDGRIKTYKGTITLMR